MRRQGDLLDLLEPSPALPTATRAALVPMLTRLLLEAAKAEGMADMAGEEADDEPDRT